MEPVITRFMSVHGGRNLFYALSSRRCSTTGSSFTVVEVGPRDGLQNQRQVLATRDKLKLIEQLADTGLKWIEATSFVSPKWVPQMADNAQLMQKLHMTPDVHYPVLVPNDEGLENALKVGVKDIAIFAAASESFSKKNLNCSIEESLKRFENVTKRAKDMKLHIRGYVSCVLGCPYEGHVASAGVTKVASQLMEMGCDDLSLGDTIGVGTPGSMRVLLDDIAKVIPIEKVAVHCHDTYGQALVNVLAAIDKGVRIADSSVAGLGGCPYAVGASGNLATEDLLYMLHGLGFDTNQVLSKQKTWQVSPKTVSISLDIILGVDLNKMLEVSSWISALLERPPDSKVSRAKYAGVRTNVRKSAVRA